MTDDASPPDLTVVLIHYSDFAMILMFFAFLFLKLDFGFAENTDILFV